MRLNPNLSFQKTLRAALYHAETELLASIVEEDRCGECRWYHPENGTCQKIKAATGSAGYVTNYQRRSCSFAEPERR